MLTVALATVRTRLAAFAGTLAALALGVSVIAMMTLVLAAASAGNPHQRPERFAAAPFVIHVDPSLRVAAQTPHLHRFVLANAGSSLRKVLLYQARHQNHIVAEVFNLQIDTPWR